MTKQQLIAAFLNAHRTWQMYCLGVKSANKQGNNKAKSALQKAVFFWRKECERLKKLVDFVVLCR